MGSPHVDHERRTRPWQVNSSHWVKYRRGLARTTAIKRVSNGRAGCVSNTNNIVDSTVQRESTQSDGQHDTIAQYQTDKFRKRDHLDALSVGAGGLNDTCDTQNDNMLGMHEQMGSSDGGVVGCCSCCITQVQRPSPAASQQAYLDVDHCLLAEWCCSP